MTARVFVHPRCSTGPAKGALEVMLDAAGFDLSITCIGQEVSGGPYELLQIVSSDVGRDIVVRMDGTRFPCEVVEGRG
jgi:hypothetical protein